VWVPSGSVRGAGTDSAELKKALAKSEAAYRRELLVENAHTPAPGPVVTPHTSPLSRPTIRSAIPPRPPLPSRATGEVPCRWSRSGWPKCGRPILFHTLVSSHMLSPLTFHPKQRRALPHPPAPGPGDAEWERGRGGGWRDAGALSIVTCCPVKAVKTRFAPQIEAAPPSPNPLAALPRDRGRRPDAACQTTEVDEASLGAVIRANLSMADGKELLQDVVRPGGTTDSPHPVGPPHDRGRSPRSSGTVPSHGGWFKRKGACH